MTTPLVLTLTRRDDQPPAVVAPGLIGLLESHGYAVQRLDIAGIDVLGSARDFTSPDIGLGDPLELSPYDPVEPTYGMGV